MRQRYRWLEEANSGEEMTNPNEIEAQRKEMRGVMRVEWMSRLAQPKAGIRTVEAIRPILLQWLNRDHRTLAFQLTQAGRFIPKSFT
ncbi:unnamed protein product [Danaus chrysippus]|uniref:(African queen) hypothetical protein n=1 Tax=Danaus chrysippus TaxID=151541 RepID=A0A8J2QQK9_9NEOP|nr:unnamed protein product [Danaus chrysippus]